MIIPVRQSTAFETAIGPILDADGVAVTNGVVGDFKIKKTTGNFAALNGSATLTHVSAGIYDLVLTTSDTDTVGTCVVAIDDTTNACASLYLQVMEEEVYDDLYAASAVGYLKPTTAGRDLDVSAGGEAGVDWANVGSPTTTVNLSGTTIATTQQVDLNTIKTQSVTCSAGVTVSPFVGSTGAAINGTNANTLSSHDPGETIMGATDLGTGTGFTAIPWNAAWAAEVRTSVGLATANLDTQLADLPTNAELATALAAADDAVLTAIAALNNLSAAQVNTEVLDVFSVDTFSQPGQENPAASQTLAKMLAYLYKAWRNKTTQTSSEYALYADDGTTKDQEAATTDDGTTFTRAEVQTGA